MDYDEIENALITLIRKDRIAKADSKQALELVASLAIQLCRDIHRIAEKQGYEA